MLKKFIEMCMYALISMAIAITAVLGVMVFLTDEEEQKTAQEELIVEAGSDEETEVPAEDEEEIIPVVIRQRDEQLDQALHAYISEHNLNEYSLAYCIEDMESGELYSFNTENDFFAASVYKLPLAMVYCDMIAEGEVSEDTLYYFDSYMMEDAGYLLNAYGPGSNVPLGDLLDYMIRYSDNSAAHILFEYLGGWLTYKDMMRDYTDIDCVEFNTYENITCAHVMSDVLHHLYENRDRYADLIEIMEESEPARYLDSVIEVNMPQKYGSYDYTRNASGFVEAKHPYTIVVLTTLGNYGETVMGELNEIVYEFMNQ